MGALVVSAWLWFSAFFAAIGTSDAPPPEDPFAVEDGTRLQEARAHMQRCEFEEAAEDFESALELSDETSSWVELAECYELLGEYPRARAALDRAAEAQEELTKRERVAHLNPKAQNKNHTNPPITPR
jgi:tetratricopeptide (TPR) repeat protein